MKLLDSLKDGLSLLLVTIALCLCTLTANRVCFIVSDILLVLAIIRVVYLVKGGQGFSSKTNNVLKIIEAGVFLLWAMLLLIKFVFKGNVLLTVLSAIIAALAFVYILVINIKRKGSTEG